jgi:glutamine amidotransferase
VTLLTIGLIDYGMGNHASVTHSLRQLGLRVRVGDTPEVLDSADVLLLPGVGAFPAAMRELHRRGLVDYLQEQARAQRPIVGICLGMQLLASASWEHEHTAGLDLVPGEIVPFADGGWQIGWNTLEVVQPDPLLLPSDGEAFYFNHSFHFRGPDEFQFARTRHATPFASIIRRGNVVGLQFHPEKSQLAGRTLLRNLMEGLANA